MGMPAMEVRPWTADPPAPAAPPAFAPMLQEPSRPTTVPSIRASPRAMLATWREEQTFTSKLSKKGVTPMAAEAEQSLAARLSMMHTKQMKASAQATERAMQMEQVLAERQAMQLQLEVLRASREELSHRCADLESRLRTESRQASDYKRQVEKLLKGAKAAAEQEANARAEAADMALKFASMGQGRRELEHALKVAKETTETMRGERDAAMVNATTKLVERDAAAGALAEQRTEMAMLEDQKQGVQRQLETARMSLIDEREARRSKDAELVQAVAAKEDALKRLDTAQLLLERAEKDGAETVRRGRDMEALMKNAESGAAKLTMQLVEATEYGEAMAANFCLASSQLDGLRQAVNECMAAFLVVGNYEDPIRRHNEALVEKLFGAVAQSGGVVTATQWEAQRKVHPQASRVVAERTSAPPRTGKAGAGGGAAAAAAITAAAPRPSTDAPPPAGGASRHQFANPNAETAAATAAAVAVATAATATAASVAAVEAVEALKQPSAPASGRSGPLPPPPAKLALMRRDQRESGQLLLDAMARMDAVAKRQRHRLQQQLHAIAATVQYRGDNPDARAAIVHVLQVRGLNFTWT